MASAVPFFMGCFAAARRYSGSFDFPVCRLLVGVGRLQECGFLPGLGGQLQTYRQPFGSESARNGYCREAPDVKWAVLRSKSSFSRPQEFEILLQFCQVGCWYRRGWSDQHVYFIENGENLLSFNFEVLTEPVQFGGACVFSLRMRRKVSGWYRFAAMRDRFSWYA